VLHRPVESKEWSGLPEHLPTEINSAIPAVRAQGRHRTAAGGWGGNRILPLSILVRIDILGSRHPLSPLGTAAIRHFAAPLPNVSPILRYGSPDGRLAADIVISPLIMNDVGMVDLPQGARLDMEIADADFQHFVLPYLFSNY
jgi:hypothetical protein